jgi:hypothetical protein
LSSLLGIATIPALYALGCALIGRRVGLGAAWLLAILPWHIWYSQEARMYAAVGLLGTLSLLAGARWLRQPGPGWGAAYVLATVAGIYCDYTMFLLWPAVVVGLPALTHRPRGRAAATWLGLQLAVLVGILPLSRFFAAHFPIFASPEFLQMRFGALTPFLGLIAIVIGAGGCAAVIVARRLRRAYPAATDRLIRAACIALLAVAVGLMLVPGGMTVKRVLLITAPLICLGGAGALNESRRAGRDLLAVLAASAVAVAVMFVTVPKEPWREIVAYIQAAAEPGDVVLLAPNWTTVPFDYYDGGRLPRLGVTPADLTPQFPTRLAPYRRLWLVLAQDQVIDPQGQVPRWIAGRYALRERRDYYQMQVQLFALPGP